MNSHDEAWESGVTVADVLLEVSYDPSTGIFTRRRTGRIAGSVDSWGHRQIRILGRLTMAHRLAWLIMKGQWPDFRLDHEDGNPDNNKWNNLRSATPSQNTANSRLRNDNEIGLKGVSRHISGRWQATVGGRYVGLFDSPDEAHAAYRKEAIAEFGDYARFE